MNPLEQLADIQLPAEVSFWPLALGYQISIVILIIMIVMVSFWYLRRQKTKSIRQLRKSISRQIALENENNPDFAYRVQTCLKLIAQHALSNTVYHDCSSAYGEHWKKCLELNSIATRKPEHICTLYELHQSIYNPAISIDDKAKVKTAALAWVNSDFTVSQESS